MARTKHGRWGVIGGLGTLVGADVLAKIVKASSLQGTTREFDVLLEHEPFDDGHCHVWTWGHREVLFRGTLMAEAAPVIGAAN